MKYLSEEIIINLEEKQIKGILNIPQEATGIVLFAHGSGSGRLSPRNQMVAEVLNDSKMGTLLLDLLTEQEEEIDEISKELRFDISFLGQRLKEATLWIEEQSSLKKLKIGYFGASTGAAAALVAASEIPHKVHAIVSRGGRPDLAGQHLSQVLSPTLLIVGGDDTIVIELNKKAYDLLVCEKRLEIIEGASHLFEEPGTLIQVAHLAAAWFQRLL